MKAKIALQVYSVRDDASKDLKGTLAKIKEMGYDGVQFAGLYGNDPMEVKAWCEEIGIVPISAHVGMALLRDTPEQLEDYAKMGCKYIALAVPDYNMMPWTDRAQELYDLLAETGRRCNELGMKFSYHNHDLDMKPMDGTTALDLIYENVDPELLQAELDLCWVYTAGHDPVIYINRYKNRSDIIHFKDSNGRYREHYYNWHGGDYEQIKKTLGEMEFRPVGHGMLSYHTIIQAVEKTDIEWVIVEQDRPSQGLTPMECAKASIDYLKSF